MGFLCFLKYINPFQESFVSRLTLSIWEWRCLFLLQSPNLSWSFSMGKSIFCFEFYKKKPFRWRERYLSPYSLLLCFFLQLLCKPCYKNASKRHLDAPVAPVHGCACHSVLEYSAVTRDFP